MSDAVDTRKRFGTFTGVFTPTLLTILGVILYLRMGWVVGNAGIWGAYLVLALGMAITTMTGLSLASIATNTRIGEGGPYAIIAKSLGLEVGASIGIPLYLTRPLGIAMYVFGFREGWNWIFPDHPALVVDLIVLGALFAIAYRSADLAARVQFGIMAVIAASLVSIFSAEPTFTDAGSVPLWGDFAGFPEDGLKGTDFWAVFALFFPATTGILAGANMSGDLKDPRRSIPIGALWAIALSTGVYFAVAWWCSRAASAAELVSNYNLLIDRSRWPALVLAGLLGATFSSALAGMVGGPRILMAMGADKVLPKSRWLAARAEDGEPRNAMMLTGLITLGALMLRDLNVIAPLVTMFFLITYCTINVVVLLEGSLGLVSFRPTLRVPLLVPLAGTAGSIFAMSIISPTFAILASLVTVGIYVYVRRLGIQGDGQDVRSSVFEALAEWAAKRASDQQNSNMRAWKPKLLVPVEDPSELRGEYQLLLDVARPEGSIELLGIATIVPEADLRESVQQVSGSFRRTGVYASWSVLDAAGFATGTVAGLQALQGAFFRPNILFLSMGVAESRHELFGELVRQSRRTGVGVLMLAMHPRAGLGRMASVNLWIAARGPDWDIDQAFGVGNLNLQLLIGYRLSQRWGAKLSLVTAVSDDAQRAKAGAFLHQLRTLARLPKGTRLAVHSGPFDHALTREPGISMHILGLAPEPDFDFVHQVVDISGSTCLFVRDSGRESARA